MIEREIMAQKMKEFQIQEYVGGNLKNSGYSHIKLQRTPVGEKIIVYASRPGLVVGRQGSNIRKLTIDLKEKFGLENPQIEVGEVENIYLDPRIVGEMIALSLERFGTQRFKGIMHKMLTSVLDSGGLGIEIVVSGKIPSARARSWRVYAGYLKKCGDIAVQGVRVAHSVALLKTGIVGIKVSIMPKDIILPDKVTIRAERQIIEEIIPEEKEAKADKKDSKSKKPKAAPKKAKAESGAPAEPAKEGGAAEEKKPKEPKAKKPKESKEPKPKKAKAEPGAPAEPAEPAEPAAAEDSTEASE